MPFRKECLEVAMSSTKVWIPETLKIPTSHQYHDQLLNLVNYLLDRRNSRMERNRDKPIRLGRKVLKMLAGGAGGGHGNSVRDELEKMGFLTVDHYFCKGRRVKHVTLNPEHCDAPMIEQAFHKKPRRKSIFTATGKPTPIEKFLLRNLLKVSSSHIKLENIIRDKCAADNKEALSEHQIKCLKLQLNRLQLDQHYGNRRNKGRRFYSDLCAIAKPIRRQLTIKGEPLLEIDIKCCQPCLLHHVLSEHNKSINKKLLLNSPTNKESKYKFYVEHGEFYQQWADLEDYFKTLIIRGSPSNSKREFCRMCFGFHPYCMNYKFGERFQELFPDDWAILENIKQTELLNLNVPKKDRHKQLAWKLQRMESTCVIDDVVGEIINQRLDIPIITIHDAILTTSKHAKNIKQLLKHSFLQRYDLNVGVEIKGGDTSLAL